MWTFLPALLGVPLSVCSCAFVEPLKVVCLQTPCWHFLGLLCDSHFPSSIQALPFWPRGRSLNPNRTPLLPEPPTGKATAGSNYSRAGRSKPGGYINSELASRDVLQGHPHRLLSRSQGDSTRLPSLIVYSCHVGKTRRLVLKYGFYCRSLLLSDSRF